MSCEDELPLAIGLSIACTLVACALVMLACRFKRKELFELRDSGDLS